jgi:hypothetical protein
MLSARDAVELLVGLRAIRAGDCDIAEVPADEAYYVTPKTAAAITGISTQRLAAMRRRGELRSIGTTPTEYKRAREAAGWGDASGWGPGVFYLRADVEALCDD